MMETLSEATRRLGQRGYAASFRPTSVGGRAPALVTENGQRFDPGELVVDEVVRFEGESDPGDEAALFALRDPATGLRGTLAVSYGPTMAPGEAAVLQALRGARKSRPRQAS